MRNGFQCILGGLVFVLSYKIEFFVLIGVLVVVGLLNSVRNDLFTTKPSDPSSSASSSSFG